MNNMLTNMYVDNKGRNAAGAAAGGGNEGELIDISSEESDFEDADKADKPKDLTCKYNNKKRMQSVQIHTFGIVFSFINTLKHNVETIVFEKQP